MIKKIAFAVLLSSTFADTGFAVESKEYCDQKCSPDHCKQYTSRVSLCKNDCPDHFVACYAAVPADRKASVDAAIAQIEQAMSGGSHADHSSESTSE